MYALYHVDWYMHSNVCIISPGICIPTFALYHFDSCIDYCTTEEDPQIETFGHNTSVKFKVSTATYKLTNHNQLFIDVAMSLYSCMGFYSS